MRRLGIVALSLALSMTVLLSPVGAQAPWWNVVPEENIDLPPGLIPYHEIGSKLREIDTKSDRVQVEVIGQSAQGRDLYLATVADPKAFGKFGRYKALRRMMLNDPERAQQMVQEFNDFKVPVLVNASIHGNEWEGVDASLALIERLAFSDDPATRKVLDNLIVLFNVVQNPDGRVNGVRSNGNGFDLNRDFVTLSQPESRATVKQIVEWHPMSFFDLHGYVNPYLIEPTTPPHNPNYEYDLYIEWALDQALQMEAALDSEMGLDAVIPFRDWEDGWDDWPPIFAPMYAMYHGSYGHTMESPFRSNGSAVNLPEDERRQRAEGNTQAHMTTVWAGLQFSADNRREMVRDQIEVFRRGWLGEPQVPIGDTHGEQHEFIADFPDAYVIPVGDGQRSKTSAMALVNHLLDHDVEVEKATQPFTAGGTTYPAGSFIVRMKQPKRGMANTILEPGWDISDIVPVMYDISGWSQGELWGADRTAIRGSLDARTSPVTQQQRVRGSVSANAALYYELLVNDPAGVRAVNALLDRGLTLHRADDGRVFIPAAARTEVQRLAMEEGLDFAATDALPTGTEEMDDVRIAAAAASDERFVLPNLGFEVDQVSTSALNSGFQLDDYDVLFVGSGLRYDSLNEGAQQEVDEFLENGGGVVGRTFQGARFNDEAALLDVTRVVGPGDANGIAVVENASGSPITSVAPNRTFVYSPVWWTDLGFNATASQRFQDGDFFIAGHWIGQEDATGEAIVVHGVDETGARVVLFGSDTMFRSHPRGLYAQAAHAMWWSGAN